jgi:hypothetical protein
MYRIYNVKTFYILYNGKIIYISFRYEVSDSAAAALANALLKDFDIITEEDRMEVIDNFKIQQEKQRLCADSADERIPDLQKLSCIVLDSKRNSKALVLKTFGKGDNARHLEQ